MSNQLQVILDEQNVTQESGQSLLEAFGAPFTEAGEILATYESIKVADEEDFATMAEARDKRLALKRIRTGVESKRKELKEGIVKTGRAIDSVARFVRETIEPAEKYLESQEKFAEIKAAERAAALKAERIEALSRLTDDITMYNFESMTQEQFDQLIKTLEAQRAAEVEAAKKAEEERLAKIEAEKKRQAEIEAENARLKAEAEEREKAIAKEKAEHEAKLQAEREKLAALEREKQEAAAKAAKEKAAAEEQKRQELLAPDKQKLLTFADQIDTIELPVVTDSAAVKVLDEAKGSLASVAKSLRSRAEEL